MHMKSHKPVAFCFREMGHPGRFSQGYAPPVPAHLSTHRPIVFLPDTQKHQSQRPMTLIICTLNDPPG